MIPTAQPPVTEIKISEHAKKWIGDATMEQDGTIRVRIRIEHHGTVGEALTRYKPGDRKYGKVHACFPDLRPGIFVPIYDSWNE